MCSMSCLLPLLVPTVPGPLSPVPCPPKKINPKGVYPMDSNVSDVVSLTSTCSHCPWSLVPCPLSPVPCPPKKKLILKVCIQWSPMCSMSGLLPLLVPTVPGPLSPVPCPPKKINPKGVYPMESNVFDVGSLTSTCSHCPWSLVPLKKLILKVCIQWSPMCSMSGLLPLLVPTVPGPLSPVPCPHKKINPKGVYPMDSNVFDVGSLTSTCSHCPWSLVPCPLSP